MEILIRLILTLLNITNRTLNFLKSLLCPRKLKTFVPINDDPILNLSATILAQKVRDRKVRHFKVVLYSQ